MLGVMFFAFMVQIVFRYFFNFPTGWTTELTVVIWLWMVLWGAAFVVKESEEIRIDLAHLDGRAARGRIAMALIVERRDRAPVRRLAAGVLELRDAS